MLDLLIVFLAKLSLINQKRLFSVGNGEVVSFLVIIHQRLGSIIDLNVVHRVFGKVQVSDLIDSVISIISNNGFSNDFVFDFVFFPSFFLKIINVILNGFLLEAAGDKVDLQE